MSYVKRSTVYCELVSLPHLNKITHRQICVVITNFHFYDIVPNSHYTQIVAPKRISVRQKGKKQK